MNQVKGYINITKSIASQIQTIKKVNTVSKLQNNDYLVSMIISKKNIAENSSLDYQNLYQLKEDGFHLLQRGSVVQQNLLTSYSNDKERFIKQQQITDESEKPRQVIEIHESGKLLFSINTQKYHEEILNNEMVGEPFKWNKKNNKVLYLAKGKSKETKTFFQVEKEEEIQQAWNYRKYEQSWGERMDNVEIFYLFMIDIEQQKLFKVQTPGNLFLTYPQFTENDEIILGGYQIHKEFKYGIVHCFNRESGIYLIEHPKLLELPEKGENLDEQQLQLLSKHDISVKPLISPDYKKLLYLGSDYKHQHLCYLSLNMINLDNKSVEELIGVRNENDLKEVREKKEKRDKIIGGICGFYDDLSLNFWNKDSTHFVYSSIVLGQQKIFCIDVNTKQIEILSHKVEQDVTHNCEIINYDQENDILYYTDENINQSPILTAIINAMDKQRKYIQNLEHFNLKVSNKFIEEFVFSEEAEGFVWQVKEEEEKFELPKFFKQRPLIVLAHGGPHGTIQSQYTQLRHILLQQGFILLAPNFSGSCGYGQNFIEALSGKIGEQDAKEILDMISQVQQKYNTGKTFIMGGSYGGYLSALMGSRYHDRFNAAVILNPVVNLPFMINITDIPEWGSSCALNRKHTWNLSVEDYKTLIERSPMLQPLRVPSLLLIGSKDRRCPFQQSLALRAQALEVGTEVQTYVYPNADHALADSVNTGYDTFLKILMFLNEKL
ncbi:unnamed protein product [Paramecium pentaurelia]|uniref:Acylamino-acid-releasing enzyme n=1 Tax=Paramecium pentaurelia TaxID=43138 RepID=A0A8S1VA35_9CILI|nr:unnamed protein product [Paramecium pentaurelia]